MLNEESVSIELEEGHNSKILHPLHLSAHELRVYRNA